MADVFRIYALVSEDEPGRIRYIGLTKQALHRRVAQHKCDSKRLRHHAANWIRSLDKRITIILIEDNISRDDILSRERHYIAYYKALGFNLVNGNDGGNAYTDGNKISEAKRGVKLSPAHIAALSLAHKGAILTDEHKRKIGAAHFNKPRKSVEQYTDQGVYIQRWDSARIANRAINVNYKHISACIHGKRKTAGGFIWKTPINLLMSL
jgi:hypothetical protein